MIPRHFTGGDRYYNYVWNPVVGCSPVSPGCDNCTGPAIAHKLAVTRNDSLALTVVDATQRPPRWTGEVVETPSIERLTEIGRTGSRRPIKYFFRILVGSACDIFHDGVSDAALQGMIEFMAGPYRNHAFLVLTKRPERMARFLAAQRTQGGKSLPRRCPNIWWGVSVEDQPRVDERLPMLMRVDSPNLFVVCEPLLSQLNLTKWMASQYDAVRKDPRQRRRIYSRPSDVKLKWVVAAGEAADARSRPCDLGWFEAIAKDCDKYGVPLWIDRLGCNVWYDDMAYKFAPNSSDRFFADLARRPEHLRIRQLPEGMP